MAVSAATLLGTRFHNNTSASSIAYGSVTFPTNGQNVLGIARIAVSGTITAETIALTDSGGGAWTLACIAETGAASSGSHVAILYRLYPSAGTDTTVTLTPTLSTACNERDMEVHWASGHDTASPLDTTGVNNSGIGTTTNMSVATSGSAAAGGLAVTVWHGSDETAPTGATYPGTGWTGDGNAQHVDATRHRASAFAQQAVASAGVVTAPTYTAVASSLTPPAYAIAVFKAPGAPVISVAPVVSGTASIGNTLSTTDGTWTQTPTSFSYQWQRDMATSGSTWVDIASATANTYAVVKEDIGCKIRCRVVGTNAVGSGNPAASNATSVVPTPSGQITYRIVAGPVAQSDAQHHRTNLTLPVLPGDLMVLFAACSNANITDGNGNRQDVGIVEDVGGHTWTQDSEAFSDTNIQHSAQAFSAQSSAGLAYNSTVTMTVHGMVAADAGTPDVANNPAGYHGQSPWWFIVAISTGDSRTLTLDGQAHQVDLLTSHVAPSITTTRNNGIVFGFAAATCATLATAGWWTPAAGFTEIADVASADASGGESQYQISASAQVVTSGYTGGAGGTTAANRNVTNLVIAYSAPSTGGYRSRRGWSCSKCSTYT